MPQYSFQNPETEEVKDIFFHMNDEKIFIDEDGVKWKRIYTIPNSSIDTKIDPFSEKQFVDKTGTKKGTVGDMMDLSAELSSKRQESTGSEDPVKRKLFNDYEKKVGKKHLQDKKKVIETSKVKVEL